jgi:hypothetical protein
MTLYAMPVQEPPHATRTRATLALLTDLFDRLHAAGIRYCHWKSNEHLDASLTGATDLDVLVDRRDARRFAAQLTELAFKPFRKLSGHDYPGIEDYLGFDADTGKLSHLHVHYQLTLGEKFLKGYRLPWEDVALATRIFDAERGLYVIDPQLEVLLLVTRAALKLRTRDYLLTAAGYPYMRGGILREFRWLAQRADEGRLRTMATTLVGERAAALLSEIVATPVPSIRALVAFERSVRPRLGGYRMYGALDALRRRKAREWSWMWAAAVNWYRGLRKRSTRVSPTGGLTACVTGPQPEATAVAQQLVAWLASDVAVVPDLGARSSGPARRARGRGMIVIADRLRPGSESSAPDVIIALGEAPVRTNGPRTGLANVLLRAKQTIWDSI